MKVMEEYDLTKEDWDSIIEVGQFEGHRDPVASIPSKVCLYTQSLDSCSGNFCQWMFMYDLLLCVLLYRANSQVPGTRKTTNHMKQTVATTKTKTTIERETEAASKTITTTLTRSYNYYKSNSNKQDKS